MSTNVIQLLPPVSWIIHTPHKHILQKSCLFIKKNKIKRKVYSSLPRPGLTAVRRGFLSLICSCLPSSASLCWLRFFSSVLDGKNRPTVCVWASAHMRKPAAGSSVVDSGAWTACQDAEDCMRKSDDEDDIILYTFNEH